MRTLRTLGATALTLAAIPFAALGLMARVTSEFLGECAVSLVADDVEEWFL